MLHTESKGEGVVNQPSPKNKNDTHSVRCAFPPAAKYIHTAQRAQFRMESEQHLQLQMPEITRQWVGTCTPSGKPPNLSPFSHLSGIVWRVGTKVWYRE